nr:putative disease resistance protein RGA3 isoform X2 [Ziziphus jujuba var. spinosa]
MAEVILFNTANRIIGRLGSEAVQEVGLLWGVKNELQELEDTISIIKDVLVDAEEQQVHNVQIRNWLKKLEGVVYEADDLIDDFDTEALRRRAMSGNELTKKVRTFFSSSNQLAFRSKMIHKIIDIKKKLDAIAANRTRFHLEKHNGETTFMMSRLRKQTHAFVRDKEVIGRDDDRVKKHFDLTIWICVSDSFDLKLLLERIIVYIEENKRIDHLEMDQLQRYFREQINGKRYFLVLDDVWNENREKWLGLQHLLMSGAKGSRVVVTTRSKMVAKIMGTMQPYYLGILDEDKSWSLFKTMAFKQGEEPQSSDIVNIGKAIVKRCGGIPLALRTIGNMLYFQDSETKWLSFKEKDLPKISQNEDDILPTLKLSYDYLPSHLKHCFSYCSLFPKDHDINVQTLINYWITLGFVKSPDQTVEDEGYEYFLNLLQRSFLQEVKTDKWGNIKKCKMHDLMHDLAIFVRETECAILPLNEKKINKETRHVSFGFHFNSTEQIPASLAHAKRIRTFLLCNQSNWGSREASDKSVCDAIIFSFKFLRMLDLHGIGIQIVPSSIGKLKHLRYLDLSENKDIKELPNSITKLQNLHTLKLDLCRGLQKLPRDIKKLFKLQNLEINWCDSLTHMPCGLGQLTDLRTLSEFILTRGADFVKGKGGGLNELMALNNLRGRLKVKNLRHGMDASEECKDANLKEKQHLQSLKLDWDPDDAVEAVYDEMALEGLQPHQNLKELMLTHYGGVKFSGWLPSLTNLVILSLKECKNFQHLPFLNQFRHLKVLELKYLPALEYISNNGDSMNFFGSQELPSLKELTLKYLPSLKGWWRHVSSGDVTQTSPPSMTENHSLPSFPCLSTLRIEHCPNLISMPLYPYLEERLVLNNTSWKPMDQTMKNLGRPRIPETSAENASSSSSTAIISTFPTSFSSPLSMLRILHISHIDDLQSLPDFLKGLTSLRDLRIESCRILKHLFPGIQHLTSLENLKIVKCEELDMSSNADGMEYWRCLRSLRSLRFDELPNLVSLPDGLQHVTSLQELQIQRCDNLSVIPEWISKLKSLKKLEIWVCSNLKSLPEGLGSLTTLQTLEIWYCPVLLEKCQKETGEDWPKIAHIPHLHFVSIPSRDDSQSFTARSGLHWKIFENIRLPQFCNK